MISAVVMKGVGDRALCAGGDVATLAQWNQEGPEGIARSKNYFGEEYKLDHLIATYSKPYISFMVGITMGGGVGLSVHAPFRIATEKTLFAMPETSIGFFPEVGGSFFLPRLDGQLGKYLALTSERLKGVQALYVFEFIKGNQLTFIVIMASPLITSTPRHCQTSSIGSLSSPYQITLLSKIGSVSSTPLFRNSRQACLMTSL